MLTPSGLWAPEAYFRLTDEERARATNGCGPARALLDFVPDMILGVPLGEACGIHDFMYAYAAAHPKEKVDSDSAFLFNMLILASRYKSRVPLLHTLRRCLIVYYYLMVHFFGGPAFWYGK